jgi:Zn-dependent protease
MRFQVGILILTAVMAAWVAAAYVVSWPRRRERRFNLRRRIAASRRRIWNLYRIDLDDPDNAALNDTVVAVRLVSENPKVWEASVDTSGGHGTHLVNLRWQTLVEQEPEIHADRVCEIDGQPFPYGAGHVLTLELVAQPEGTLATLTWSGETATLWQYFNLWRVLRRYLRRLQQISETGAVAPSRGGRRPLWVSLGLSVLAVGGFALWLGWLAGVVLAGIVVLHEFGHWLAMRLTGQPAPRIMLVPFFGGVAVGNHPHKSQFDAAFCALMGPGFSAFPCLALLVAALVLGSMDSANDAITLAHQDATWPLLAKAVAGLAAVIGLLNLIQLLPVLPLDGGQILRALVQSFSAVWARRVLLALTGIGTAGFFYIGDLIIAGFLALGALQAWHMGTEPPRARPMRAIGASVICIGYGLTLAVHAGTIVFFFSLIGRNPLGNLNLWQLYGL